jgi:fructose-specific phosphotransferase system IIC component
MKIDCGRCQMRGTGCYDCVITVLGPRNAAATAPASASGYLGEEEVKALGVLAAAGMVPPLRFSLPGSTVLPGARAWMRQSFPDTKAS